MGSKEEDVHQSFESWCNINNPKLLEEWHPTKNNGITPSQIRPKSNKNFWWLGKCGHEWETSPNRRLSGYGCPICAGKRILVGYNDLQTTNPSLAKEWHPTKNGNLKPTEVLKGSHRVVWWQDEYGHDWEAAIYSRASGKGCPICYGRKTLIGFNDLQTKNPKLAEEWHPTRNGNLKPTDVTCASNKKVWWMCKNGHEWEATVNSRNRGNGCKVCAGQTVVDGVNSLLSQRPDLAEEWDYEKNTCSPKEIAYRSNLKVWWRCKSCGHSWIATPDTRSHSGCPKCASELHTSFGEKAIAYYLSQVIAINERYRNKKLGKMELDIFIPSIRVAIEYDGQFFHQDVEKDQRKNEICKDNDIELIRLRESGCPVIDSLTINVNPDSRSSLTNAIKELINHIKNEYGIEMDIDVDTERDSISINEKKYLSRKDNSLEQLYPHLAKEFHPSKNGSLKPNVIPAQSNEKVWWICDKGHE